MYVHGYFQDACKYHGQCSKKLFYLAILIELRHNFFIDLNYAFQRQRELDGYPFPVFVTESCPRNEAEWNKRSAVFNCTKEHTYACFPNNEITELIEFCYPLPLIAIPAGFYVLLNILSTIWLFRNTAHLRNIDTFLFVW